MAAHEERRADDLVDDILFGGAGCVGDPDQDDRELVVALRIWGKRAGGNRGDIGCEVGAGIGERKLEAVAILVTDLARSLAGNIARSHTFGTGDRPLNCLCGCLSARNSVSAGG